MSPAMSLHRYVPVLYIIDIQVIPGMPTNVCIEQAQP